MQACIHRGSIVFPSARESRSVLVGIARNLTLGLPADATTDVETALASAPQRAYCYLPEPDELMGCGASILESHKTAAKSRRRSKEPEQAVEGPSPGRGASPEIGERPVQPKVHIFKTDSSKNQMAAKVEGLKEWLKTKMRPLVSKDLAGEDQAGHLHPADAGHGHGTQDEEGADPASDTPRSDQGTPCSFVGRGDNVCVAEAADVHCPARALMGLVGEGYQVRCSDCQFCDACLCVLATQSQ
jgi:hypothetical protein